jgi:hypothetical protein
MRPKAGHMDAVSDTAGEAVAGKRRRRAGRGWGPFSGGQLTVIIVAISVMILLPVGAFAVVSGSNVFVTDAVSGKQQSVNGLGQALVAVKAKTGLISSGTMAADPFASTPIFTNVNTSDYAHVRLFISETGANPATQTVNVLSSVVPYVLDNFVMNTTDVTRIYELPGVNVSLTVTNSSPDPAMYVWRLYARSN